MALLSRVSLGDDPPRSAGAPGLPASVNTPAVSDFLRLDQRIREGSAGIVHVSTPSPAALGQHLARRLRSEGRTVLVGERSAARPALIDLIARAGLGEVRTANEAVHALTAHHDTPMILAGVEADSWDSAVLEDLQPSLLVLAGPYCPGHVTERYVVDDRLGAEERAQWLAAMQAEIEARAPQGLGALETWLASTTHLAQSTRDTHHDCALHTVSMLGLVGRPLSPAILEAELGARMTSECLAHGAHEDESGHLSFQPTFVTDAARIAAAELLEREFSRDPWAFSHAASLYFAADRRRDAERCMRHAFDVAADAATRRELLAQVESGAAQMPDDERASVLLEAAERALGFGESELPLRWLRRIRLAGEAETRRILVLGRALHAAGDFVAAKVALLDARRIDSEGVHGSGVAVALAELAYAQGNLEVARGEAESALNASSTTDARLRARNVLGKVLLAQGKYADANMHFAQDAMLAASLNEPAAEMRAELNRGIALLSQGHLDDAERQFEAVLHAGETRGDSVATSYALPNLAVVATRKHHYGRALELWERAASLTRSARHKLDTIHSTINLADMRLRLGLLDQAAHMVVFTKRALGSTQVPSVATWLHLVEAGTALRQGDTSAARRAADRALEESQHDPLSRHACLRTLARIALEDGDVRNAGRLLDECESLPENATDNAEPMLLRAILARSLGDDDALERAKAALPLLRDKGDEELLIEGLSLVALCHQAREQHAEALEAASRAAIIRDNVAATLHGEIRASYLAKRENMALQRLLGGLGSTTRPADSATCLQDRASEPQWMVGSDPSIVNLRSVIGRVARTDATVLIHGESGTGKELVAAALHRASGRANGPLITVNCAALVENLLLSELFGHEKGAFTGASARRRGRFELAEGGTLFLDEIGDISPRTQVALLRVLQEKTFERVGGALSLRANVRVVCATHRNLPAMVERGEFREDLYYRLSGIVLPVPSLRQRLGDLPSIAEHLLERIARERGVAPRSLSRDALELLARHRWPGNVRELENVLRALTVFCDGEVITASDLMTHHEGFASIATQSRPHGVSATSCPDLGNDSSPLLDDEPAPMSQETYLLPDGETDATRAAYSQIRSKQTSLFDLKRQIERDCILKALQETSGNITHAATLLGMKRPRLSQLVKQYQLSADSLTSPDLTEASTLLEESS